jgi:hypothetical protein
MTSSGPWDVGNSPGAGRFSVNPEGSQPKFSGSTSGLKLAGAPAGCPVAEAAVDVTWACCGTDDEAGEVEEPCRVALRPTPATATSTTAAAASAGISHDLLDRSMCCTVTWSADK